jgi:hypothetical protein
MKEAKVMHRITKNGIKLAFTIFALVIVILGIPRLCYWLNAKEIPTTTMEKIHH